MDVSCRTAIARKNLSKPMKWLDENGCLQGDRTYMLDYGCGIGYDADTLGMDGFDPQWRNYTLTKLYKVITCNYVLNVVPKPIWQIILQNIQRVLDDEGIAYIAVRDDKHNLNGFIQRGTYQVKVELDLPVVHHKRGAYKIYKLTKQDEV